MTDWTAIAAGATALAAAVTAWMAVETHGVARETKEAAKATERSADATQSAAKAAAREARAVERELEVSTQPWLAWTGDTGLGAGVIVWDDNANGTVAGMLRVKNVGNGLALIRANESRVLGGRDRELKSLVFLRAQNPVLPPGEVTQLRFEVASNSVAWGEMSAGALIGKGVRGNGLFAFDVLYSDSAGAITYTARFQACPRETAEGGFIVFQVDYFREDDEDPMATVRVD